MHFASTVAAGASLLAIAVFVGPALAAPPKHIWASTPSSFDDSTASLEGQDHQLLPPAISLPFRAGSLHDLDGQDDMLRKRDEYCPYHRDFAKHQACVVIGHAERITKQLNKIMINLAEASDGGQGCFELKNDAKHVACYMTRMLRRAEATNQLIVQELRLVAVGPHDVQRPRVGRSMRAVEGGPTTDDEAEDTTWLDDDEEAAMLEKVKESITRILSQEHRATPDQAITWFNSNEEEAAMRKKVKETIARLLTQAPPATLNQATNATAASGSMDLANTFLPPPPIVSTWPHDISAREALETFLASLSEPVSARAMTEIAAWADCLNKDGVLPPEAAASLGLRVDETPDLAKRLVETWLMSMILDSEKWDRWENALTHNAAN